MIAPGPRLKTTIGKATGFGGFLSIAFFVIAVAWAYFTMINGAVIATGSVVVPGRPKSVQHLDGGIVQEILIADGDVLAQGDVLLRLDDTLLRANLEIYRNRLGDALAREARLDAEQVGQDAMNPPRVSTYLDGVDLSRHVHGQQDLFQARRDFQLGLQEQLTEKVEQFNNQIIGVEGLLDAKRNQLSYIERDLEATIELNEKGLALDSQVLTLQGSQADILGQISEHLSELARIQNSIRDTEMEMLQSSRQFKEQAVTQLREVTTTVEELVQQISSTQKQLDRIEIRSPVAGIVHELQFVTLGGVVPPGATILQIIPTSEGLAFEMRVDPRAIDSVFVGQDADVLFSAFNSRSTPKLHGVVAGTSPTSITDPATGFAYYRVDIAISTAELTRLEANILVPGMPVEAFIQTGERSVLSYLTKPLMDQVNMAFREE